MGNAIQKKNRVLDIFYRAMKGENLSVAKIANEYEVSTKSISRDINDIKNFLSDNRELVGNTELQYSSSTKSYHDKGILDELLEKELYHYNEVNHDCKNVIDNIWQLTRCIHEKIEISVTYYKIDRKLVERKIKPIAIMFSDYYFYLIAYHSDKDDWKPLYYRVDRIINIVKHRSHFTIDKNHDFDEGDLRNKIQFMFTGEFRNIKFEYTGPSVQAILDKIPTAKIVEINGNTKVIEAKTFGRGINMFLLSQGKMVKVLEPQILVEEMKEELKFMIHNYNLN